MSWSDLTDGVMGVATAVFGDSVTYTPSGGQAFEIEGIFRDQYLEIDSNGYEVLTDTPVLGVRNSDFSNPPLQGDTLVYKGVNYTVQAVHKDGDAGSTLVLQEGLEE